VTTEGELTLVEEFNVPAGAPIGLGFRVPLMLISPWTRGHYVYSEVGRAAHPRCVLARTPALCAFPHTCAMCHVAHACACACLAQP
jgi:phospholipase C